jgi:hypothetical protein
VKILLEGIVIKALEGLGIVKLLGQRVGSLGVLTQDVELQVLWPPVTIPGATASDVGGFVVNRAFTHDCFYNLRIYVEGGGVGKEEKESSEEEEKKKTRNFLKCTGPRTFLSSNTTGTGGEEWRETSLEAVCQL